jgi:hypothetical protein
MLLGLNWIGIKILASKALATARFLYVSRAGTLAAAKEKPYPGEKIKNRGVMTVEVRRCLIQDINLKTKSTPQPAAN